MACRVGVPALDVAPHRIAARCRYGANRTATQVIPSTGGPQLLVARRNSYLLSAKHTITHTSCRASKKRPLHSFTHNVRSGFVPKLLPRGRQLGTSFSGRNVRGRAHADESSKDDSIPPGTVEKALRELSVLLLFTGFTGAAITFARGAESGTQFFAGFLLEESLSVDNLLVFVLIFSYFKTPVALNEIVLKYGLYGAAVLRAIFILLGAAILSKFRGVMLVFAVILLYSAYGILAGDEEEEDLSQNNIVKFAQNFISVSPQYDGNKFFTMVDSVVMATPLFLTVAVIELSDLVFAVDSIPAVFGITTDPLIVYSSNMCAILTLRSLFPVVEVLISKFEYLQTAVGVVLGFIGIKIIVEFFGLEVDTVVSLEVVAALLATGVGASLMFPSDEGDTED